MAVSIYQVDAFTNTPFSGNPAAVCVLHQPAEAGWMQSVATEMNLSETAFVHPMAEGFGLRWFTPSAEVQLCGHATLAAAHVLLEAGILKEDEVAQFSTLSGVLRAKRSGGWIQMDFPAMEVEESPSPQDVGTAIGIEPEFVGICPSMILAMVDSEDTVRDLNPDYRLLLELPASGVIVTAKSSTENYDFVSRFFAPRLGIVEDPVTGSAHCCLGPFWQKRLHKDCMVGYQASQRGGFVRVEMVGDRAYLAGQAVTIMQGVLL